MADTRIAVDWLGEDWAALYTLPTDAVNIFGADALEGLPMFINGAGGSAALANHQRYGDDRAKYGKTYVAWETGTVVTANVNLGYDAVTDWTIPANTVPTGTYTAVFWVLRASGNDNTFRMLVMRDSATTVATGSSTTVSSSAWQKFTLTFSFTATAGNDRLYLMLQRTNGSGATQTMYVTGPMIVAGSTAPEYFNHGATALLCPITAYVMDADFSLGFTKAYQYVAPVGKATIKLTNADQRFSPEAGGAIAGIPDNEFVHRLVQIGDPDYGIWWTGWTDECMPVPGENGEQSATITATDARRFLTNKLPVLPLYTTQTTAAIIADILSSTNIDVPNTTDGIEVGAGINNCWSAIHSADIITGYADSTPIDHDAPRVLADILTAVQGKLWFNRLGQVRYDSAQGDSSPSVYTDIGANWMDAGYTTTPIINVCEVMAYIRKSSSGSFTVWEMDDVPFALGAGATEQFRAYFKNSTSDKILAGASGLAAVETNSGAAGDITAALSSAGATSVVITFTNTVGGSRNITAASITATTRITQLREISKETEVSASVTLFGRLAERITSQYVQLGSWAKRLANYRTNRFGTTAIVYEMPWVTMSAELYLEDCFDSTIGTAVHVTDSQTGHDKYYAVIGEQHKITDALTNHTVKLYLEPLYDTTVASTSV